MRKQVQFSQEEYEGSRLVQPVNEKPAPDLDRRQTWERMNGDDRENLVHIRNYFGGYCTGGRSYDNQKRRS